VIGTISRHLLPITAEEVLFGRSTETPIFPGVVSTFKGFLFGTTLGTVSSLILGFNEPTSVGRVFKSGLSMGFEIGLQSGIAQIVQLEISCRRGRESIFDPIVAGATAGAICGAPWGLQSALEKAVQGACAAALMELAKDGLDYLYLPTRKK
jgi:hypothetical protein